MATIIMESAKVIEAATKTIAYIDAERLRGDEEAITHMMAKPRRNWMLQRYHFTREQAIEYMTNWSDGFGWRSIYAWGDRRKAKALLLIAQHGDPVTLNEEDTRVLFGRS